MRIDVHAHYFPEAYLQCLDRMGFTRTIDARRSPGFQVSLVERLALMDGAGIDMQVLSPSHQLPYLASKEDAVEAARLGNDLFLEACRKHPGRFSAFANLPLPHVGAAIEEMGRCLDTLGMVGVTIGCSVAGRQLDDPEFIPLWEELERRRAVLFFHPVGAGGGPGTADYGLTWMVGAPLEDSVTALRLVLSGLVMRYPNVKIIVPHLGGTIPFLLQRIDNSAVLSRAFDTGIHLDGPPSQYLKKLWYDTVSSHPSALRCSCECFGANRLLLGTDWPYLAGPKFKRCVTYIQESGLPQNDVDAILDRTAQELLGIKG